MVQRATLNEQPSSSGTVTLALTKATAAGHALIVGVSFWPLDVSSVTDNSGDSFTRGLGTSIYHNVSRGVMYTNFYYAKSTAGGATSITLHFSRGSTYVVAAVSEVAGLNSSAPLDRSAYNESLSSASPWASASLTTAAANEYLFAWAADEWSNPSCSNVTSGWTKTQNTAGATLCLLDRTTTTTGSYQVSVTPSTAFNYAMEIVGFKGASSAPPTGILRSSSSNLAFGSVLIGSSSPLSTTLTNTGTSSVTLSRVSISGSGFNASGISTGQIIGVGQTATLNVTFAPAATGSVSGSVTVASNASSSPVTISLSGIGSAAGSHSAALSWTASKSVVIGYNVYRSSVSGGPYTKLTASVDSATSYSDSSVQAGLTYYYVVTAVNSSDVESAHSMQVSATIP